MSCELRGPFDIGSLGVGRVIQHPTWFVPDFFTSTIQSKFVECVGIVWSILGFQQHSQVYDVLHVGGPGDISGSHCNSNSGNMNSGPACARDSMFWYAVLSAWLVDQGAAACVLERDPVCVPCATTWASTG
jgi:hypothetical protein